MNFSKKIDNNHKTPMILLLEALSGMGSVAIVLRNLRQYCLKNHIHPQLDATGLITVAPSNQNYRCAYIADCINNLCLGEEVSYLIRYLQTGSGVEETIKHIRKSLLRSRNWAGDWSVIPQHYLQADKRLRRKWALYADRKHFSWHIFSEIGLDSVSLSSHLPQLIVERSTLDEKQIISLLALSISEMKNCNLQQVLDDYWLARVNTENIPIFVMKLLQAFAAIKIYGKKAVLMTERNALYLKPGPKNRVEIVESRLYNEPLVLQGQIFEQMKLCLGKEMDINFAGERVLNSPLAHYQNDPLQQVCSVIDLMNPDAQELIADEDYRTVLANKANIEFQARKKQQQRLKQERHRAAANAIAAFAHYRPMFFDIYGYDLSGARRRLFKRIASSNRHSDLGRFYGDYLSKLVRADEYGNLYRDMMMGVLLAKLVEDAEITKQEMQQQLHPNLLKLIAASRNEYKCEKKLIMLCDIEREMTLVEKELIEKLFVSLQKGTGNLVRQISNWKLILREWKEKSLHHRQGNASPPLIAARIKKEYHTWLSLIDGLIKHNLESPYIGKMVSRICYLRSVYQLREEQQCAYSDITPLYQKNLDGTSSEMQGMHREYLKSRGFNPI